MLDRINCNEIEEVTWAINSENPEDAGINFRKILRHFFCWPAPRAFNSENPRNAGINFGTILRHFFNGPEFATGK
jgi:hypothetical protein